MGQVPAQSFPFPTPFGQSPDSGVLTKAMAAPKAPLNNFMPLNPGAATTTTPAAQNPLAGKGINLPGGLNPRNPMYGFLHGGPYQPKAGDSA